VRINFTQGFNDTTHNSTWRTNPPRRSLPRASGRYRTTPRRPANTTRLTTLLCPRRYVSDNIHHERRRGGVLCNLEHAETPICYVVRKTAHGNSNPHNTPKIEANMNSNTNSDFRLASPSVRPRFARPSLLVPSSSSSLAASVASVSSSSSTSSRVSSSLPVPSKLTVFPSEG
jgi:hypothetical protein